MKPHLIANVVMFKANLGRKHHFLEFFSNLNLHNRHYLLNYEPPKNSNFPESCAYILLILCEKYKVIAV